VLLIFDPPNGGSKINNNKHYYIFQVILVGCETAQSVQCLDRGYTVRGSNLGEARFSVSFIPTERPTQPPVQCVPGLPRG
jgi:hypothetical protein